MAHETEDKRTDESMNNGKILVRARKLKKIFKSGRKQIDVGNNVSVDVL